VITPTWDIMICSIPHRDDLIVGLLAELDRQLKTPRGYRDDVKVLCFRDNLQTPYGLKLGAMTEASQADYVCSVDDDDGIAPDYVERITTALAEWPDYVGFRIAYTVNGSPSLPVHHSLRYGCWENRQNILVRDISEKNPIRREIALTGTWTSSPSPDSDWANGVRRSGQCRTEVWIDADMYYYRFRSEDSYWVTRNALAEWEPLPVYPWLTQMGMA
jgi:hypothetical protein